MTSRSDITPAGVQSVIPGMAHDAAELAKRCAAAPLTPRKPQAACDVGLFGDDARQSDLVAMVDNANRVRRGATEEQT